MEKSNWARGRSPTHLVRMDEETHGKAKKAAEKAKMSLRAWIQIAVENMIRGVKRG